MSENDKKPGMHFDLDLIIAANGKEMQNFYNLPPEERQQLLDKVSKTNRIIKDQQTT